MTAPRTTSLLTDRYELTMLQAALQDGTASRHSVFELFARRLSGGRRYGVVAGIGRALDALEHFRFAEDDLAWLRQAMDEPERCGLRVVPGSAAVAAWELNGDAQARLDRLRDRRVLDAAGFLLHD